MTAPVDTFLHGLPDPPYVPPRLLFRPPGGLILEYHLADRQPGLSAPMQEVRSRIDWKGQLNRSGRFRFLSFLFDKAPADGIPGLRHFPSILPAGQEGHCIGM